MITKEQIRNIAMRIASTIDPDKIILFGSYATGTNNETSDIDLLIIKDSDLPRPHRGMEVQKLFYRSVIPMDIKVYTPDEYKADLKNKYSFLNSIIKESLVLYERKD